MHCYNVRFCFLIVTMWKCGFSIVVCIAHCHCSLFTVIVNVQCCNNIVGGLVLRCLPSSLQFPNTIPCFPHFSPEDLLPRHQDSAVSMFTKFLLLWMKTTKTSAVWWGVLQYTMKSWSVTTSQALAHIWCLSRMRRDPYEISETFQTIFHCVILFTI